MASVTVEVRCVISRSDFKDYGSSTEHTVRYKRCNISLDAPYENKVEREVICPICGKTIKVEVVSSKYNSIKIGIGILIGLLIALFMGYGWYTGTDVSPDSIAAFYWIGFFLLFVLSPLLVLFLVRICIWGAGPSASFLGGGDHEIHPRV
jgi:hypothetical protein